MINTRKNYGQRGIHLGTYLEVVDARPPNYDAIVAVLPDAAKPGVMFAYGGKVYFPGGKGPLTRELDAHERVHLDRQDKVGLDNWWRDYLESPVFRQYEEFLAHREEYETYCKRHINPIKRAQFLRQVATRMSSSLYGMGGTREMYELAIKNNANPCEPT